MTLEQKLKDAIVLQFEGVGEAWTTDDSGDTLARIAAQAAVSLLPTERDLDLIEVALKSVVNAVHLGGNDFNPLAKEYLHALASIEKLRS